MVIVSRKNLYSRQQRIPNFSRKREKKISRDINKNILRLDKKKYERTIRYNKIDQFSLNSPRLTMIFKV